MSPCGRDPAIAYAGGLYPVRLPVAGLVSEASISAGMDRATWAPPTCIARWASAAAIRRLSARRRQGSASRCSCCQPTGPDGGWWSVAYGVAAILGHVRPVFFLWRRGGKGVATAAGVFLALTLLPAAISTGLWLIVLMATRYVSVASLAAATALPIAQLLLRGPHPVFWMSVVTAAFVWLTHRAEH